MKTQTHRQIFIAVITVIALLGNADDSFSQLQVAANNNAAQLANQLAGQGVTITNATLNCPSGACGTFNGSASNLGISNGIMLTSGSVNNAVGPNSVQNITIDNGIQFSDPNLIAIEPLAYYDPCILQFTFVPTCSTISFTFAFGSDEYHEFVNMGYNDAFGIFITGPNPSAPAYNGYNMALIPFTATAVSIDNVNNGFSGFCNASGPCTNCAYFVDNCNGATIEYDGFTTPITVTLNVVPCATYQLKLAIADAGDNFFDAGVFFKQGSLTCNSSPLTLNTSTTPAQCSSNNGSATVTASGGTQPYTYAWSTTPPQNTQTATGLAPGNYTVTVQDASGCFTGTATVTIASGGGFTAASSQTNVTCFGANNGSASVTPSGGNAPYTYSWSTSPVQTTQSISNILHGNYTVAITDATGCSQTAIFTVTQPPALTVSVSATPNNNCVTPNGSASVNAGGGTPSYTYSWTPSGQTSPTATGLNGGMHTVIITDANGCTQTGTVSIANSSGPNVSLQSQTNVSCNGGQNGTATVTASGGSAPYLFSWSPFGGISTTATGLPAGTYTVIVTDASGCTAVQTVSITELLGMALTASSTPASCGIADGNATASASGGATPYTYMWLTSPVQTNVMAVNLQGNATYTVIVTDANGCTQSQTVFVSGGAPPATNFSFDPDTVYSLDPIVLFTDLSNGAPSNWNWNFGDPQSGSYNFSPQQNPSHIFSDTGTFCITLFISDASGVCTDSITKCLKVLAPFTFYIPNAFTPNEDNLNELFAGMGTYIRTFQFMVFDRWGNLVFISDDLNKGWDGKVQNGHSGSMIQEDVYVWKVLLTDMNNKEHKYIGHVSVIK